MQDNTQDKTLRIGFIGIGVLGKGLALSLAARGYRVVAASSRRAESARWLSHRLAGCAAYPSAQEVAGSADLVFITTPDSEITGVASSVRWRGGQGVVHCCGAAATELLEPAAGQGAVTGALHPFQTFAGLREPEETASRLAGVAFAVAGDGWLRRYLSDLAVDLGGHPVSIPDEDRPLYHASAVLGCGYLVALLRAAAGVWEAMGFTPREAIDALYPLARATLENVAREGIEAGVTGPIVRGDAGTVRSHLEALENRTPELVDLYRALTRASLPLAAARGVASDRMAAIAELVDTDNRRRS